MQYQYITKEMGNEKIEKRLFIVDSALLCCISQKFGEVRLIILVEISRLFFMCLSCVIDHEFHHYNVVKVAVDS